MAAAMDQEEKKDWKKFTQEELDKQYPEQTSVANRLCELARNGQLPELQQLATTQNCGWRRDNVDCRTPLHCAAWSGSNATAMVQHLLSLQASVDSRDYVGWTPLHCAADKGNAAAVQVLAAAGAAVNDVSGRGATPLMEAAHNDNAEATKALLEAGADLTIRDSRGRTARKIAEESPFAKQTARLLAHYEGEAENASPQQRQQEVQQKLQQWRVQWNVADQQQQRATAAAASRQTFVQQPEASNSANSSSRRPHYAVTQPQGICLVINNEFYSQNSQLPRRTGSRRDVQRICAVFSELQFELMVVQNLTAEEMRKLAVWVSERDHSRLGTFVCFLLAHGTEGAVCGTDGQYQTVDDIASLFASSKCESLNGKPKIFFVQACRVLAVDELTQPVTQPVTQPPAAPEADFLLCYATCRGPMTLSDLSDSSPYVQAVCDQLQQLHAGMHLADILTRVNEQLSDRPAEGDGPCMLAEVVSRLSGDVMLHPGQG